MVRLLWMSCFMVGVVLGQWQEQNMLLPRQNNLDVLESMGIQLLSSILSPSAAASTSGSSSTTASSSRASTTSSSTSSSSSSASSSAAPSSSISSFSAAAATITPTPTDLSNVDKENTRHRNIAIIVGSVLGAVVILLALALLLCCLRRRRRARSARNISPEKIIDDDDELDGLNGPPGGAPGMAYVTRIESWHEPRTSRNSSRGPPRGSQSRVSLVQRDPPVPEQYHNGPGAPVPIPVPPPHRASSYGLISSEDPYAAPVPQQAYFDRPHRHSMDDASRDPRGIGYPGYVPYRSTHSLVERSPTPLFGSGKTPGETQHTIKRKSVGSTSGGPTAVNTAMNSKDPSPASIGGGPWVPPRSKRRESLPGSPLQHEFEFGFENPNQQRRISRGERMPGGWSNTSIADAHQRF